MTRILGRGRRPLFTARPFTNDSTTTGPTGVGGASLYVASGPAGSPAPDIVYRKFRMLGRYTRPMKLGNLANNSKTCRVASVTEPTKQFPNVTLAADKAYRFQVRPWKDDQELPTTFGERTLDTGPTAEESTTIDGNGYLVRTDLCENGGVRFWFVYNPSLDGVQPLDFVLSRQSGPTSPASVVVPFSKFRRLYLAEVSGLQDAGAYVFRIAARNGATTLNLDNASGSGNPDIAVTPDAAGPPAVSGITWEVR